MSAAAFIVDLLIELGGLLRDVLKADAKGTPLRADEVLEGDLPVTAMKAVKDARARLKFRQDRAGSAVDGGED